MSQNNKNKKRSTSNQIKNFLKHQEAHRVLSSNFNIVLQNLFIYEKKNFYSQRQHETEKKVRPSDIRLEGEEKKYCVYLAD
jgi:hypothetical protein